MPKHKPTPMDIDALFSKVPFKPGFSFTPHIPTQLKEILKAMPEYDVTYLKKVVPKPQSVKTLLAQAGYGPLRGVGYTRKNKDQTKKARKTSARSRARNRRS